MNNTNQNNPYRVTVGQWIIFFILMVLPIANIIYFIVKLFGDKNNPQTTLCRAVLLIMLFGVILAVLIYVILMLGLTNTLIY